MAKQKKPVHRVQMTEGKRNIIHQLLEELIILAMKSLNVLTMTITGMAISANG